MSETSVPRLVAKLRNHFPGVNRVADGKRPISVEVTAADCKRGDRSEPDSCAMARACRREMECDGVLIWRSTAWVVKGDLAVKYHVPPSLGREIVVFDRGGAFLPGTYGLSAVPKSGSVEDAKRPRRNKISGGGHGKPARKGLAYHRTESIRVYKSGK